MNMFLLEKANAKAIVGPVDLNTAAVTGARVGLKGYDRVTFVAHFGASTSATDVSFVLRQHNASTSGTSKDVAVLNPYFHKLGSATSFTKVVPSVATADYDLTSLIGDNAGIVVFEVLAEDLDVNGNFNFVSVDTTDAGAAKICSVVAYLHEPESKPAYSGVL